MPGPTLPFQAIRAARRRLAGALPVSLLALLLGAWSAPAAGQPDGETFAFAAFGDMPYRPADGPAYGELLERLRAAEVAFTVHVGDIKSGGTRCDDDVYAQRRAEFAAFPHPLIYVPGDNEWTDCHRLVAGGYDPLERLAHLREVFFARPWRSLGLPMALRTQANDPAFRGYPEHTRWARAGFHFATLHVVGSHNNRRGTPESEAEFAARNRAVLAWLKTTFAAAREAAARGVVLFMHADPEFEAPRGTRLGFEPLLAALEAEARDFGRPVLLIHGDTHGYRVDRPLSGTPLQRAIVPGAADIDALMVRVDPGAASPFTIGRLPHPCEGGPQ